MMPNRHGGPLFLGFGVAARHRAGLADPAVCVRRVSLAATEISLAPVSPIDGGGAAPPLSPAPS